MISSKIRTANLITLLILIVCCLSFAVNVGKWLNPSPSDIRLSFAQTSAVENSFLPQKALDNNMPQLGKAPYWIDGKLAQLLGRFSPYVLRYFLFFISLSLMYFIYSRFIKPEEEDLVEWSLIFLLTIAGSFFFTIKYFFWLDYLAVLPFTLLLVLLMRRNAPGWIAFLLVMIILYVKISSLFILFTFFGMFASPELVKKYRIPLAAAVLVSIGGFFLKWGPSPIGDRGHRFIIDFSGYAITGLNLISRPWIIFSIFDKSVQKVVTEIDIMLVSKFIVFMTAAGFLILRKIPGTTFRLLCIFLSFASALALLRDTPTIHDFAAYNGIVELGCLSLIWILYRHSEKKMRYLISAGALVVTIVQFCLWNSGFKDLEASVSKVALTGKILEQTKEERTHLFLFCSGNVGEFEYFLKDVKIHYSLWEESITGEVLTSTKPAILLIPKKCQHEEISELMNRKYSAILKVTEARHLETVQIDKNQIYDMYEAK